MEYVQDFIKMFLPTFRQLVFWFVIIGAVSLLFAMHKPSS